MRIGYIGYFYLAVICSLINVTGFRPLIISFGIVFAYKILQYNKACGKILIIENILCSIIGIFVDLIFFMS